MELQRQVTAQALGIPLPLGMVLQHLAQHRARLLEELRRDLRPGADLDLARLPDGGAIDLVFGVEGRKLSRSAK